MLYENPELYDELQPVSEDQLNFYRTLAQGQGGPVLELACGSGQLIVPIAGTGLPAVGLDRSPEMLMLARRRAVAAGARVEFVDQDMRDFDLGQLFSMILVVRNSLLHLSETDDFAALFSTVRRHLTSDGVFAFDIFNPDLRLLSRPTGERFPVMRVPSALHGELIVEATNDYDRKSQINRATWFISTTAQRDRWVAPMHLRSIFPEELLVLLAKNGFRLMRRDGDYRGSSFTGASGRQVCQCRAM